MPEEGIDIEGGVCWRGEEEDDDDDGLWYRV